jgi:hypothetical protein
MRAIRPRKTWPKCRKCVGAKRPDLRKGSDEQRKEPRKPESITDPTANCRSPNGNRRQTMATAVYGHATRATPNEFSGFPKIKPVAGQSPLPQTPTADHRTRRPAELV